MVVRARATVAVGTGRAAQATAKEPKRRDELKLCAHDGWKGERMWERLGGREWGTYKGG